MKPWQAEPTDAPPRTRAPRRARLGAALMGAAAVAASMLTSTSVAAADPTDTPQVVERAAGVAEAIANTTGVGPLETNAVSAITHGMLNPLVAPEGVNDWDCVPTAERPRPIVLVHGTYQNAYSSFSAIGPALQAEGHCVFALNYGITSHSLAGIIPGVNGTAAVADGAKELARYVDAVLAQTGADQVDLVGYSQGAPLARQYLRFEGGADPADPANNKVKNLVSIAGTNHGTTLNGIATIGRFMTDHGLNILGLYELPFGTGPMDQAVGSPFLTNLNAGGDTEPGIDYTVIASSYDQVSTPYQASFLEAGPGATVRNIRIQDGCEQDWSDHLSLATSPRAIDYVLEALDPESRDGVTPRCAAHAWITGK
ncbi:esterase/lipase family protein [Rhodococcus triatomae]|uniref:esterase/lipase family protein n=1 Tax=Rhodococcus triatomae TaxID=300028 RepID=UPI001C31B9BE|nr:alpha/beta fold hydrolase [Rhodococcus triatomae]